MDSFEWNKIAGAVLFALTVTLGLGIFSDILFHERPAAKAGYELPGAPAETAAAPAPVEENVEPLPARLAKADVAKGEASFKKCAACHTIDKGGKNGVGPNLYNVLGGPKLHIADYAYSDALKAKAQERPNWGVEEMYEFIKAPKEYVPGTKMSFAGIRNPQERADLIAFLRTKADAPIELPTQ